MFLVSASSSSTTNQNNYLMLLYVYNALDVCTITCLKTCKEPTMFAIITRLSLLHAEACL